MKRILPVILLLGLIAPLEAQVSPVRFSVHFDPQFAWFSSDDDSVEPDGSIFHLNAGLHMDYFFAENYAFVLGVGVNNLGGNLRYADSTEFSSKGEMLLVEPGQTAKLNLQYIDIPLGLKFKTAEMGYSTFFFQLGFNPMININAKASSDQASFNKEDIKESTNIFCLGYHVGLGLEYKLAGNTALLGGVRWTSGLIDVTDNDRANVKINALSIHLGVLF
jgi:opacity protein-like surface antigen